MLTPQEALEDFLAELADGTRKPNTIVFYRSALRQLVGWMDEQNVALADFTQRHTTKYMRWREDNGANQTTRYHDATCARLFFHRLSSHGVIKSNPFQGYKVRKPKPKIEYVPSRQEVDKLLKAVKERWTLKKNPKARFTSEKDRTYRTRHDYCIIKLLAETGCRNGEACGLKRADVILGDKPYVIFRGTKTGEERACPVSAEWVKSYKEYLLVRKFSNHENAFITPYSTPMTAHWLGNKFAGYVEYAGLSPEFTPQALRRHRATLYVENGDLAAGAALLGHSTLVMLRHYAKRSPEFLREAWERSERKSPTVVSRRSKW